MASKAPKAPKASNAPKLAPASRPASPAPLPARPRSRERVPLEAQRKSALPPVRVTPAEHDEVRAKAKAMGVPMGELIRRAVLGTRVQGVPAVNREIWGRLGPLIANLNIYAREVRRGRATGVPVEMIEQLREDVDDLREYLLGRDPGELRAAEPAAPPPPPARKPGPAAAPKRGPGRPRKNPPPQLPASRAATAKSPKSKVGAAKSAKSRTGAAKRPAPKPRAGAKSPASKSRTGAAKRHRR